MIAEKKGLGKPEALFDFFYPQASPDLRLWSPMEVYPFTTDYHTLYS